MKQLVLDLIPPLLPTFANFIAGRNREVLSVLQSASFTSTKIFYLWGATAAGKTHLLQAVAHEISQSPLSTRLFSGFANDLPDVLPETSWLVVDDVHALNESNQIKLFNLINLINMPDNAAMLIASGNVSPRDLLLRRDLTTRLGSGLTYQLHALNENEKLAALRQHASARGFELRDDVAGYLLRHTRRDMRSLIAMLDTLDQYSLETNRVITLPLLREAMQMDEP